MTLAARFGGPALTLAASPAAPLARGAPLMRSALALVALLAAAPAGAAPDEAWVVAGRQGIVQFVIVPADQARDAAAHARQVLRLCGPQGTCFLNFYTNTSGAPLAMPLPEAITKEATAIFRRSVKQGSEQFQWSCRLQLPDTGCF